MLTITIQTASAITATNSAGVTTTTPIRIATQPSHLGSKRAAQDCECR